MREANVGGVEASGWGGGCPAQVETLYTRRSGKDARVPCPGHEVEGTVALGSHPAPSDLVLSALGLEQIPVLTDPKLASTSLHGPLPLRDVCDTWPCPGRWVVPREPARSYLFCDMPLGELGGASGGRHPLHYLSALCLAAAPVLKGQGNQTSYRSAGRSRRGWEHPPAVLCPLSLPPWKLVQLLALGDNLQGHVGSSERCRASDTGSNQFF